MRLTAQRPRYLSRQSPARSRALACVGTFAYVRAMTRSGRGIVLDVQRLLSGLAPLRSVLPPVDPIPTPCRSRLLYRESGASSGMWGITPDHNMGKHQPLNWSELDASPAQSRPWGRCRGCHVGPPALRIALRPNVGSATVRSNTWRRIARRLEAWILLPMPGKMLLSNLPTASSTYIRIQSCTRSSSQSCNPRR